MGDREIKKSQAPAVFAGYPQPTSNTTYTPNQFFDVVLPHSSRGVVRIVAYMLRKVLGWSDQDGNPQEPQVRFTYSELERTAGVSSSAIRKAIDEAIEARFIKCLREPSASKRGIDAVSGIYELVWDDSGEYITDPVKFQGFFSGNGNLTYIPNIFFDHTVPNEPLAVVKVVGTIIRHTIGFQTYAGFRRQRVEMSFTGLQRLTRISSRRSLSEALRRALEANHIVRIEEGYFDMDAGKGSKAAIYGVRWQDTYQKPETTPKRIPGPNQKGYRHNHTKKATGNEPKRIPEAHQKGDRDQSKKDTGIEIKLLNNTLKITPTNQARPGPRRASREDRELVNRVITPNPSAEARTKLENRKSAAVSLEEEKSFRRLLEAGFDERAAKELSKAYPFERIARQCNALPQRNPRTNKLGLLRRAIEGDWPAENTQPIPSQPLSRKVEQKTPESPVIDLEEARALEHQLRASQPDLYQAFVKAEKQQRLKIEQMPMVGKELVKQVLNEFDAEEKRLVRMITFIHSRHTEINFTLEPGRRKINP